jgi:hypothetical protein
MLIMRKISYYIAELKLYLNLDIIYYLIKKNYFSQKDEDN